MLYTTYRFGWTSLEQGLSLSVVGVMAVVVLAVLLRALLPRFGDRRILLFALINSGIGFLLYGLATEGWMMYAILIGTSLSFLAQPAAQGLISNAVQADEQGAVQGALTSVLSLTAVVGPLIATAVFSYFTSPEQPLKLPGAAFYLGSALTVLGLILAVRTFAHYPAAAKQAAAASRPS